MKILRLRLSNLNSLRGDQPPIDFTVPPLADAGLFAITGPTGAGKTTLLDAITLALYGRVARYGKEPSPDAVMSRHTGECSAEVEFSCSSGVFRAVWQLQRARKKPDGHLQAAKRRVIALPSEVIIAESIKDADAKIIELTGLDYDRFLRSVLLPQGDFAAFLKSGPKERTELLQEVTGTAIYRDISRHAYRLAAEAQQAHANLLRDHQLVPVLPAEVRAAREADLAATTTRLAELTAALHSLHARLLAARRWIDIETDTQKLAAETDAHEKARAEAAPGLAALAAHETAAPFSPDLSTLARLLAEDETDSAALQKIAAALPDLEARLQSADATAKTAETALVTETQRQLALPALWQEIDELDRLLAITRASYRELHQHHAQLDKSARDLAAARAKETSELADLESTHAAARAWLEEHRADATLADQLSEIHAGLTRWSGAETAAAETSKRLSARRAELEKLDATALALERQKPPLQTALEAKTSAVADARRALDSIGDRLSAAEIEQRRDTARERRVALEALAAEATRLRALDTDLLARRAETNTAALALKTSRDALPALQRHHLDATRLRDARRQTLGFAERVRSLESHRATLRPHEACPLCGSPEHPFLDDLLSRPTDELAPLQEQAAAAEADELRARAALTEAEKKLAALQARADQLAHQTERLAGEHAAALATWRAAAARLDFPAGIDAPALAEAVAAQHAEETRRHTQLLALRAAEQTHREALEARLQARAALDKIIQETASLAALARHAREHLPADEDALRTQRETIDLEHAALADRLAPFAPAPTDLAAAIKLQFALKLRADSYREHQSKALVLAPRIEEKKNAAQRLAAQEASTLATAAEAGTKVASALAEGEKQKRLRLEKFGEQPVAEARRQAELALARLRSRVDTTRADAQALRHEHARLTQERERLALSRSTRSAERQTLAHRLESAARETGFADLPALRAALLAPDSIAPLTLRRRHLEERRIHLATRAATLADQRAALPAAAAEDAARLPELEAGHTAAEDARAHHQGLLGELRATLANDDTQRARQAAFADRIAAAHRDYARWDRLRQLIGSADGSLFARFAQGLTLQRLTVLANRHLARLNPRYSIRRAAEGETEDLELEIVDHYQADTARPMRSLSGGECFLASLALALGLSELASGRTRIESLFIDEGFGTLDPDTLEVALSALENLQSGGKTIGVISHVPAMQERIPTQIKITKESGGISHVTVQM